MSPKIATFLFIEWADLENVLWCLFSRATFTLCCLCKPHLFLGFLETTMSSAEADDGGLLPSLQFVDVVVLRTVAMMSILPVRFEILFQNYLGLIVGGGAVRLWELASCLCKNVCHFIAPYSNMSRYPLQNHFDVL